MEITITIPEVHGTDLAHTSDDALRRHVLEALAAQMYAHRHWSREKIRRFLGLDTREDIDGVLKRQGVPLHYTLEDLDADRDAHRRVGLSCRS